MPTERFHKLIENKKKAIRQAVIDEFSRVPFEKASINQMIQNAGISRGSFYTYFEDKKDVLTYIFSDSIEKLKEVWVEQLEKNHGDIWDSAESLLDYMIVHTKASNMFHMMNNLGFSHDMEAIFQSANKNAPGGDYGRHVIGSIFEKTDTSNMKLEGEERFERLFQLVFLLLMSSVCMYYKNPEDEEKLKKNFREELEILQYGICNR